MRRKLVIILIVLFVLPIIPLIPQAHAVLSIDTSTGADTQGGTQCGNVQSTCTTFQFSTTTSTERLFAFGTAKNPTVTMSLADNSGLSWTKRTSDLTVGSGVKFAEWTAVTSSQLLNDRITLTVGAASGNSLVLMVAIKGTSIGFDQAVQTQSCALATSCSEPISTYNHPTTLVIQGLSTDDLASSSVLTNCAGSGCTELQQNSWGGTVRASEQYTAQQPATMGYTEAGVAENFELITEVINEPTAYVKSPSGIIGTASSISTRINSAPFLKNLAEPQTSLFRDDFNLCSTYPCSNPTIDSQWSMDIYYNVNGGASGSTPGEYTVNGNLNLRTTNDPSTTQIPLIETVHPTVPIYSSNQNSTVLRQVTAALTPFDFKETLSNAWVRIGFAPLITGGTYPATTPPNFVGVYGDVNSDANQDCGTVASPNMSTNLKDFKGMEYIDISDNGTAIAVSCAISNFQRTKLGTIDPTLYTIAKVTYFAAGANSWVFYSIKQSAPLLQGGFTTPLSLNVTDRTKQSPVFQTNYLFIGQFYNPNGPVAYVTSKVDLVQVQTYQGPVSLIPPIPTCGKSCAHQSITLGGEITGMGDAFTLGEPIGVVLLFTIIAGVCVFAVAWFTQSTLVTASIGYLVLGVFTWSGVFSPIVFVVMALVTTGIAMMIIRLLLLGNKPATGAVQMEHI